MASEKQHLRFLADMGKESKTASLTLERYVGRNLTKNCLHISRALKSATKINEEF